MKRRLAVDEAGYGPLLGPLVVGLVEVEVEGEDEPGLASTAGSLGLRVDDSKRVLSGRRGFRQLEAVVLGVHAAIRGAPPKTLRDWLDNDARSESTERLQTAPWYAAVDLPLPLEADDELVARATAAAASGELLGGPRPVALAMRVSGEDELNELWDESGNKHDTLFETVLDLIEDRLLAPGGEAIRRVDVDKLGGRSRYADKLATRFPFMPIEVLGESRDESAYELDLGERPIEFRFLKKGDARVMEIGLASMVAKYTREVLMEVFNRYFERQAPDIVRTAGYYEDGQRFLADLRRLRLVDAALEERLRRRR